MFINLHFLEYSWAIANVDSTLPAFVAVTVILKCMSNRLPLPPKKKLLLFHCIAIVIRTHSKNKTKIK